jgi:hypothetical protein
MLNFAFEVVSSSAGARQGGAGVGQPGGPLHLTKAFEQAPLLVLYLCPSPFVPLPTPLHPCTPGPRRELLGVGWWAERGEASQARPARPVPRLVGFLHFDIHSTGQKSQCVNIL